MAGTRPVPPVNTIRVAVGGTTGTGVNWANVFWFASTANSGPPSITQLQGFIGSVKGAYHTWLLPQISTDWTLKLVRAIAYPFPSGAVAAEVTYTDPGTKTGTSVADQVASAISWAITPTWRGGKPRTYLGGVVAADLTNPSHLSGTAVTARQTAAQGFRTACNLFNWPGTANPVTLGTVSFFSGNAPRSPALFITYNDASVHARLDTMRRRLGKET